jgi:putative transposase
MPHPYPPHLPTFDYVGKYTYFLTFSTANRRADFVEAAAVDLVLRQILRAADQKGFSIPAYCFMPDHLLLLIEGRSTDSDGRAFIRAAKQYSGYHFSRTYRQPLWQRYGHERVVREDFERAVTIGYIVMNPVEARLVAFPADYPFLGSQRYTVAELIQQAGLLVGSDGRVYQR